MRSAKVLIKSKMIRRTKKKKNRNLKSLRLAKNEEFEHISSNSYKTAFNNEDFAIFGMNLY